MRKQINWGYAAAFSVVLMFSGINSSIAAQNCVEGGDGQNHSAMRAMVDIKLSGAIKKNDEIARYTFVRESGRGGVAQCGPDSQVYAYATYGEGSGIIARYYGEIDGKPAYHVHAGGPVNIVYVLIESKSGLPFTNRPGQVLPVPEGALMPIDATVIFMPVKITRRQHPLIIR